MEQQAWRVLVVEDDAVMRAFFVDCVEQCSALALAASCASVAQAEEWLRVTPQPPDVLLVDLGLPDGSGLQVIRHTVERYPNCEPLVISMFGDEDSVLASIEAGALGYIHKDSAPNDIAQTIIEMKKGASPISPMMARRVLFKFRNLQSKQPSAQSLVADVAHKEIAKDEASCAPRGLLSPREQEVLELITRGFSYAEIARLQTVSVHTIQTHIKNLYRKLAVHSRSEAVFEASRMGLLASGTRPKQR